YRPVSNPLDFLMKTVDTARENHDNQQAMLPGYSERVIQVRFKEGEGGMNLAMSKETIDAITTKGRKAGKELRCNFDFEEHRWTRFLVLMSHLETELEKMHVAFNRDLKPTYSQLINPPPKLINPTPMIVVDKRDEGCDPKKVTLSPQTGRDVNYPYERDPDWRAESLELANELLAVIESWKTRPRVKQGHITIGVGDNTSGQQLDEGKCEIGKCDPTRTEPELKHFSEGCPEPKSALRVTPQI
ncbi:MAG TPA: hypothetical protein VEX13_11920, partial [Chloroflexia bacterium]|nr:hypothetical protein [Chloroflexia bacterium]